MCRVRYSGSDVAAEVVFEPVLRDDTGQAVGDGSVGGDDVRGWCRGDLVVRGDLTGAVHEERIGQAITLDEGGNFGIAFLDADRENFEALVAVLVVGRP